MARNNKKFAVPAKPTACNKIPAITNTQNHFCRKTSDLGFESSLISGFMKLTAKTGLKINATTNEAAKVRINIVGR